MTFRHSIVAHGRLAQRNLRLEAARGRLHGRQTITFEALASLLAGGFSTGIDDEKSRDALQKVLPETELGELDKIKLLPGMFDVAAGNLRKMRRSGINVQERAGDHPRLSSSPPTASARSAGWF